MSLRDACVRTEPKKIAGSPFLFEELVNAYKKTPDFNAIALCWIAYALLSAGGPADAEWCSVGSVFHHIEIADGYARLGSKTWGLQYAHLVGAESSVRYEWRRLSLQDSSTPCLSRRTLTVRRKGVRP